MPRAAGARGCSGSHRAGQAKWFTRSVSPITPTHRSQASSQVSSNKLQAHGQGLGHVGQHSSGVAAPGVQLGLGAVAHGYEAGQQLRGMHPLGQVGVTKPDTMEPLSGAAG